MTDDLAPRGWRNYHRSRRAQQMRRDLAAAEPDVEVTDWWLEVAGQLPQH